MISELDNGGFDSSASDAAHQNLSPTVAPTASGAVRAGHSSIASSIAAPDIYFIRPTGDPVETRLFNRLPDKVREGLVETLHILGRIHRARSKSAQANYEAAQNNGRRGFSADSLLRKYYAYLAAWAQSSATAWQVLFDKAKAGPAHWNTDAPVGLPADFLEFWKTLCERNQRASAPAYRELLRIWRTGFAIDPATGTKKKLKSIPGYPDWQAGAPVPSGWSQANLSRYAPKRPEIIAARIGRDAAASLFPQVFKTRGRSGRNLVGIRVGQFYAFDDQEYDAKVNFPKSSRAMRPVGLNCLDIASACCIAWGMKPVLIDDDGTKKKGLQQYMPWLVAHILCNIGFLPSHSPSASSAQSAVKTHLLIEAGSATLSEDIIARIQSVTAGQVVVDKGQTKNTPSFPGLFEGASKGNPRFKAHLESFFNLVRNDFALLPGQVGLDRNHCPAETAGRDKYNNQLIRAAERLSPERAALLRLPFMDFHQFVQIAAELYNDINHRTDHQLEGWEKCGHVLQELSLCIPSSVSSVPSVVNSISQDQWLSMTPDQRHALEPFVSSRSRFLSPQEVWNRSANTLQKLSLDSVPALLGPDFGVERKVTGSYIEFDDQSLDTEPFRFPISNPQSEIRNPQLAHGERFLTYQIPFSPDTLILADAKGAFVGTLQRQNIPRLDDVDGIAASIKYQKKAEAELLAPGARRAIPLARAQVEMRQNNRAVFQGQAVTPAEIQSAADLRALHQKVNAAELLGSAGAPPADSGASPESSGLSELISSPDSIHRQSGSALTGTGAAGDEGEESPTLSTLSELL